MSFQEYAESARGRLRLGTLNKKALAGILAILVAAAGAIAFGVAGAAASEPLSIQKADAADAPQEAEPAASAPVEVCVHVSGCVARPGVVYLQEGDRVADAVEAAGGMTGDADAGSVNLARVVADGEQVAIASKADAERAAAAPFGASASGAGAAQGGKVNLNTADAAQLQTISGIGPSKAQKIVEHRESSGPFKSVDDLTQVSGIGEKTLESIRDQVCV